MNPFKQHFGPVAARLVPDVRVFKTGLAAAASWELAQLLGSKHPFFAPLAAVLCLQVTVEKSIRKGIQRVIGISVGVLLASLLSHTLGVSGWSIGALIFIGLWLGRALRLPEYAFVQIGVSALLMLTVAEDGSYGLDRLVETVVGAGVAIAVNMAVVPPDYSRSAEAYIRRSSEQLSAYCSRMAQWISHGADPAEGEKIRSAAMRLCDEVNHTVKLTEEAMHALKFSPLVRLKRSRLERQRASLRRMELAYLHSMKLWRIVGETVRLGRLNEEERRSWAARFDEFAKLADAESTYAAPSGCSPRLPEPSRRDYAAAFDMEAREWLEHIGSPEADRALPETRAAFGQISDGRSRGHDLMED
ncbi:FUSC family protein [Cohnella sp. 56]|uniref:FUSC family protein n=1 Tax=Cohnella sp. 56 TaxID=3113722 RepID=UPI0030E9C2EF